MTSDHQQLEVGRPQRNGSKVAGANVQANKLSLECESEMKTISVMQNFEKFTFHAPCLRKLLKEIYTNTGNKSSKKKKRETQEIRDPTQERGKGNFLGDGKETFKADSCVVAQMAISGKRVIVSKRNDCKGEKMDLRHYLVCVNLPRRVSISEKVRR